jgi:hypothetical protein
VFGWAEIGKTTKLKLKQQKFAKRYIGLQLEVSQAFPVGKSEKWIALKQQIVRSFKLSAKELKATLLA